MKAHLTSNPVAVIIHQLIMIISTFQKTVNVIHSLRPFTLAAVKLVVNNLKNLRRKAVRYPLILAIQTLFLNALKYNRIQIVKKREVEAVALIIQQKVVTRNARSLRNQRENAALSHQIQIKQALHLLILIAHQLSPRKLRKEIAKRDMTATHRTNLAKRPRRTVARRKSIALTHLIETATVVTVITAIHLAAAIRMEKNSAVAAHAGGF